MPNAGRPRIEPVLRLRDRYLAQLLKHQFPNESFGWIERQLSGRDFARRDGNSNGFNQPQCVARAARGAGMLSPDVLDNARREVPGFEVVVSSALWSVLARKRPLFPVPWIAEYGLSTGRLARCWGGDGELLVYPTALIRRAGRLTSLDALAVLIAAGRRDVFATDFVRSYAIDVFRRLFEDARATDPQASLTNPFRVLAKEIDLAVDAVFPSWHLLENASLRPAMVRPRPPATYDEKIKREANARRRQRRAG